MASPNMTRWCALALVLSAAACTNRDRPGAASGPGQGGTVVMAVMTDLDFLNSLVAQDKWAQEINRNVLFLPLIQYGPKLEYQPRLASSWEMLGDTGVVFHLRHDVRWADGQPTTSADVLFTYQQARDSATEYPNVEYFTYWTGADAPDPYTVRFHFKPHTDPLAGLPFLPIMPKHLLDTIPAGRMRQAAFNHAPVGNGPFRFVEYRANDRWVFQANPDFPKDLGGRPNVDRLVLRIIPEPTAEAAALTTGEATLVTAAGAKAYKDMAGRADVQRIARPTRQIFVIVWNGKRPMLRDPRVRQALTLAMDKRTLLDALRGGLGQLAVGPFIPGHWAFAADLKPLPYAPDSAKKLLAAAGYVDRNGDGVLEGPTGKPLEVGVMAPAQSAVNRNLVEMLQAQLGRVGVKVRPEIIDAGLFRANLTSSERKFDGAPIQYEADFSPRFRDQFHSKSIGQPFQMASYSNPVVDSIIDRAPVTPDQKQAAALWHRFQEIMLAEQPWSFMWYAPELILANADLHGLDMDVRGTLTNVSRWWLAPPPKKAGS